MTRVFHLASDLGPCAAGKQLAVLTPALPRDRFAQAVGLLGPGDPFAGVLAAGGVAVTRLPLRHAIDANGLAAAARAVTGFRPDVLHAWGPLAARVAHLLRRAWFRKAGRPPLVLSGCEQPGTGPAGWLTRRALRSAAAVTAATRAGADRIRRAADVPATVIPPAVAPAPPPPDPSGFRRALDLPETARLVIAAGRFDAAADLRTAVWAFDVLKYAAPDLYLVLVGDGPDRERITRLSKAVGWDDYRVRFAGLRADLPAVFGLAEIAWVTHLRGGVNLALEAMAAGAPVVAAANPDLAEVLGDGAAGRLVPPGDRVRLAAVTNDLLDRPDQRAAAGAAGRAAAETRFAPGPVVDRYARLYHDVIPAGR